MSKSIILSEDAQRCATCDDLVHGIEELSYQIYNKQDSPSSQPFILPQDALSRSELSNFNRCTYRFIGEGQVAQSNFQSPQMIPAHIVIFDQDTFGVMFLELRYFFIIIICF